MSTLGPPLASATLTRLADLPRLQALIEQVCTQLGASAAIAFALRLAGEEAFVNAMQHGYGGEGPVDCALYGTREAVTLEMIDQATPFDPCRAEVPDTQADWRTRAAGGLGLHLLRQMVDEVRYEVDAERGNRLRLMKHEPGRQPDKETADEDRI